MKLLIHCFDATLTNRSNRVYLIVFSLGESHRGDSAEWRKGGESELPRTNNLLVDATGGGFDVKGR